MVVMPLPKTESEWHRVPAQQAEASHWTPIIAGAALVAGGLLFLNGYRRAGLIAAASGTALAMLDQKETVVKCWNALPRYISDAQEMLDRVQETVEGVNAQRASMGRMMGR